MPRYMLFALLPHGIKEVAAHGLTAREKDFIRNYAMPFGSDWNHIKGARGIKLLQVNPKETCFAYTIIGIHPSFNLDSIHFCLASIYSTHEVHDRIQSNQDWIRKLIEPSLEKIEGHVREVFNINLSIDCPGSGMRLRFSDWIRAQLHRKISKRFFFSDANSWSISEDYARRLYISTNWQKRATEIFRRIPIIGRFAPRYKPPTMSTLSMSDAECTRISILAIPTQIPSYRIPHK
jgi:hypothetical protein